MLERDSLQQLRDDRDKDLGLRVAADDGDHLQPLTVRGDSQGCKVNNYLISVDLKAGMETHDDVVGEDPCWWLHSATTLV